VRTDTGQALEEKEERKRLQRAEDAMWHTKLLELVRKAESREATDKNRFLDLRSDMLRTLEEQVYIYIYICMCVFVNTCVLHSRQCGCVLRRMPTCPHTY
jgi:hypothetical protein